MNFGTLSHNQNYFNLYKVHSNEIGATVWKHRMYKREHRWCEAWIGGLEASSPGKFLEKSVRFGDFWHIFMQFISCSESRDFLGFLFLEAGTVRDYNIMKYLNHTLQTNPWHSLKTSGIQPKENRQFPPTIKMNAKLEKTQCTV